MLTPKENFSRYLKGLDYEWFPSTEDELIFQPEMLPDNVARGMIVQQKPFAGTPGGVDLFGCHWEYIPAARGSIEKGNLMEDLEQWKEKITFPDLDKLDWEGCAKENADFLATDKLIRCTIFTGYFERLISFIGFEDAAMALVDEDQADTVHEIFDYLTQVYMGVISRMVKHFGVGLVEIHDDWGTQRSPIFSLDTLKEMILPYITRLANHCHELGIFLEMHSCGMIEDLIPGLIETGIDSWRGQLICDKEKLVNAYGEKFHFGVEVRREEPVTDEQTLQIIQEAVANWKGRNVWLAIGRNFTPAQRKIIYDYLKSGN